MARRPPGLPWRGRKCPASPPRRHPAASAPAPCRGRPTCLRSGLAQCPHGQAAPLLQAWCRAP
eukprot:7067377-Alexandrium_andersonii.AAC.1